MKTAYLADPYQPPIPVLAVRFKRLAEPDASGAYLAILDTGADMSFAPNHVLVELGAQAIQESQLVTQWGEIHPVTLYLVDMELNGEMLPGMLIAGDETTEEVVIGRNVLNLLPLFIDGPRRQTHLLDDLTVRRMREQLR
jgi:predicted aspartyl protease